MSSFTTSSGAYSAAVDGVGGVGGAAQDVKRALEILVPQFHLCPLAPHCRKVIHVLELHLVMPHRKELSDLLCKGPARHVHLSH